MEKKIKLGHGSGGIMTRDLINNLFLKHFDNEWLKRQGDSAVLKVSMENIALTTDSYVINPLFFPGGDIGKLAICGTVNDLSVTGALPAYITAGFIIEEGLELQILEDIVRSMKEEAIKAGVTIVAGDTKVVAKGQADNLFINTSGVGFIDSKYKDLATGRLISEDDVIIVNGNLGDHEAAVINAREKLFESSGLASDCASMNNFIRKLLSICETVHFMRDITRGGLAGILSEVAEMVNLGVEISEDCLPLSENIKSFCEIFGYDPLHMANEGKCIIIISAEEAEKALSVLHSHELGINAATIGRITREHRGDILMETSVGGRRLVEPPYTVKVPRIC